MSSLSALRRRAERLHALLDTHSTTKRSYTQVTNTTKLPEATNWADFARLTWIRTAGTIARFDPYDYQIDLVRSIHESPNTVCLKSRQMGASETVASYLGCRAATEPGFAAIVISKTLQDSSDLGRRVRRMLNSIQGHSFVYTSDSNTLVSIKGGGTLYFLPGSARAARGIPSGSVLWLDEAAFVDGAEEIYRAATPALSMLGSEAKVIVTSTPDTEVDFFGNLWHNGLPPGWYDYVTRRELDALNALLAQFPDDWNRVALHYSQHPIYGADPDWAERTRLSRRMTKAAWASEYELSFGATDTQLYPTALITRGTRGHFRECGHVGRTYVIGIDPNAGGKDFFTALVLDITAAPYEVVALYHENGRSTDYSLRHVKQLIEDFMPERVIVEKQAMGSVIAEALQGILPQYAIELFNTTRPAKTVATDRILYLLERDELIYPEGVIPEELRTFHQTDDGKREAVAGAHDDTVMALAFACSLIPETPNTAGFFRNI